MRDYGLGDPGTPSKPPVLKEKLDIACPNCGGNTCFAVEVEYEDQPLIGGPATGRYVGCVACPFASPQALVPLAN